MTEHRYRRSVPPLVLVAALLAASNLPVAGPLSAAPERTPPNRPTSADPVGAPTDTVHLTIADGTEARYRVREQLARLDFPNDAVGTTTEVQGTLLLLEDGRFDPASRVEVDLASITTDQERRDRFVRRSTLETDLFPTAVLVPTIIRGLEMPLPTEGEATFRLVGDLTLHGVTRPTVWEVDARFTSDGIRGTAVTSFGFEEFEVEKPRVRMVLSVADEIRLELDFVLERTGS